MASRLLPVRVGDVELMIETVRAVGSESTARLVDNGGERGGATATREQER